MDSVRWTLLESHVQGLMGNPLEELEFSKRYPKHIERGAHMLLKPQNISSPLNHFRGQSAVNIPIAPRANLQLNLPSCAAISRPPRVQIAIPFSGIDIPDNT